MKRIICIILLILVFMPILFCTLGYKNIKLGGYYAKEEKPKITLKTFSSGEYQKRIEKYIRLNVAFSDFFIRFSNQVRYTLLNSSSVNNVIIGKDNYIYTDSYLYSYLGRDYIGEDTIKLLVNQISQVRDTLKKRGVDLIIMVAPGKGTYYPEYFPESYSRLKRKTSNYQIFSREFNRHNINYLDFNAWMLSLKGKTKYRLFSNTSVHWGQYACYLAVDSLTNYLDKLYNIRLPRIKIISIKESKKMFGSDDDAEKLINVLENIPDNPMPNFEFKIESDNRDKLRVLSIGDSYFFGLNDIGLGGSIFYNSEFWYYFDDVSKFQAENKWVFEYDDIKKEIEKNKAILIVMTEANLHSSPKSFFRELYYQYIQEPDYKKEIDRKVKKYTIMINKNKAWLNSIKLKAQKGGIDLDSAIKNDAEYMAKEDLKKKL